MNDLISRQAAIEALSKAIPSLTTPDGTGQFDHEIQVAAEALVDAMQIIQDVPSAQRWVAVTEKLPDSRAWVLCKCRANIYEVLSWRDGEWYHDPQHRYMSGFVTHWRELPEPLKEEP